MLMVSCYIIFLSVDTVVIFTDQAISSNAVFACVQHSGGCLEVKNIAPEFILASHHILVQYFGTHSYDT